MQIARSPLAALGILVALAAPAVSGKEAKKKDAGPKDAAADVNAKQANARTVSFDTDEATWSSLDVSPDGRTIVFDLLGDLYSLPIEGGAARPLTSGAAWDGQPRFSPDGLTIAFSSDRGGSENLWLVDADGKNPRALTSEKEAYVRSPAWSPDGRYVVARKEENKKAGVPPVELWLYHRHGGSGIRITKSDDVDNASGPVFSKNGRYLYFAARDSGFSYVPDISRGLWAIRRVDRETGEIMKLTSGIGGAVRPAVSPDGRRLVYASRRDEKTILVLRDLASGREETLASGVTRDEQEGFAPLDLFPGYAFTPDGAAVVFSNHGRIARLDLDTKALSPIPFTAHVERTLAPRVAWQERVPTGPIEARILRWPSQSSDGKFLVFDAFGRVFVQRLAAGKAVGEPKRLTVDAPGRPAREYAPSISPNGKWVAYVTWSDADGGHLWKVPLRDDAREDDGAVKLTIAAGHYANPTWSPDGTKLLVLRGSGLEFRGRQPEEEEEFEIRWIPASGGETRLVANVELGASLKFHPQAFFSADGERVYYRKPVEREKPKDEQKNDLVSVRLDGTDRKSLLRFPPIGDLVPSPDGAWAAFTSRDNVYVAAVPSIQTKDVPEVGLKEGAVPVWRLSDAAGGYVGWADGGATVTWGLANVFHRLPVAEAIRFVEEERRKAAEKADDAGGKESDAKKKDDEEKLRVPKSQTVTVTLRVPRPVPAGTVAFTGARVLTMKGDEILENADVLLRGNRIAAVGRSGQVEIPADAKRIDARGKTILPGLIDTHAHLHYTGMELFPETKWEYAANLAYGVTTVYDPSAPSLDVFAQAEMVEAGLMVGPRVWSSGDVLFGGQQADFFAEVNDQKDALRQVRRMKAYGARMIKVYQQPRREQRLWFAEACRKEGMLLTAEGAGELHTDLTMAVDGFTAFEHSLPVEIRSDVSRLVALSRTHYTPTLLVSYGGPWGELWFWQNRNPHDDTKLRKFVPHPVIDTMSRRHPWIDPSEYHFPTVARGAASVLRAGGNVSLGAHGQLQGLGSHWELWAMAGEGQPAGTAGTAMTPMEALRASTILAADKLGFAPDLGSIEVGKLADLLVLDGDPLADIHDTVKIRTVVKNGEVWDAATLDRIHPTEQKLPPFFWQER